MQKWTLAIVTLCLLICGCGDKSGQINGLWRAQTSTVKSKAFDEMAKTQYGDRLQSFIDKTQIELKPGGTFLYMSPNGQFPGKWKVEGNDVILTYHNGSSEGLPKLTLSSNGQRLHYSISYMGESFEMDLIKILNY